MKKKRERHGDAPEGRKTREYNAWIRMVGRCENPARPDYPYYGARGIKVCDRWRQSYSAFLQDMGRCPEKFTLDRIDTNGNYEPGNVRWASHSTQSYNIRLRKDSTTGRTGVNRHNSGKYQACIGVGGKLKYIGLFERFEDAVAAREAAEVQYYGAKKAA